MRTNFDLASLPLGVLVTLGVVLLGEIVLDLVALISLYRRPVATVTFGNKWIWVAIIVLINLIGAILYFAIGRKPAATDQGSAAPRRSSADIADALYGSGDEPKHE